MNGSQDLNLNATECLRTVSDFGVDRVHNICSGTVIEVHWGTANWAFAIGGMLFASIMLLLIASMAISILRD